MSEAPVAGPPTPGGGLDIYHYAYCTFCAQNWNDTEFNPDAETGSYPGHWDLDQQNVIDWAKAHMTANPTHDAISIRHSVRPSLPTGVP